MKSLTLLVVCALAAGVPIRAQEPQIRPMDTLSSHAFERGMRESHRFRALVDSLRESDLIIHIVTAAGFPFDVAGTTRLVGRLGGARYVRIDLSSAIQQKLRVAILAHELQHACELARSQVDSSGEVRELYASIGKAARVAAPGFETADAEEAGRVVWTELGRSGRARGVER